MALTHTCLPCRKVWKHILVPALMSLSRLKVQASARLPLLSPTGEGVKLSDTNSYLFTLLKGGFRLEG